MQEIGSRGSASSTAQAAPGGERQAAAQLRAYGACLALLRQRLEKEGMKQSWVMEALGVLNALRNFKVGIPELKSSGIGILSKALFWRGRDMLTISALWISLNFSPRKGSREICLAKESPLGLAMLSAR
eukprot:Skav227816  [mRNA]  locus=scaffold948:199593:200541:+ [translate_table: standard]